MFKSLTTFLLFNDFFVISRVNFPFESKIIKKKVDILKITETETRQQQVLCPLTQ